MQRAKGYGAAGVLLSPTTLSDRFLDCTWLKMREAFKAKTTGLTLAPAGSQHPQMDGRDSHAGGRNLKQQKLYEWPCSAGRAYLGEQNHGR